MSKQYVNPPTCGACRERPGVITWQFEPRDFANLRLCWRCAKACEVINLRLCARCGLRMAAAIVRDVVELRLGYRKSRDRYRAVLRRLGL